MLLLCTCIALVAANSHWADTYAHVWETTLGVRVGSHEFVRTSREWINDGLMTVFFFVVALELKRELVRGEMRDPRRAALSIASALGGMLVPAATYLALMSGREGSHGWGTVMATDTAFAIGCLALLGRRIPRELRVFMLSLAVIDDVGAILVVAIGYTSELSLPWLATGATAMLFVRGMGVLGIRSIPLYFLMGTLCWLAVDASGIHATITGVVLGLLTPTGTWVSSRRLQAILDRVVVEPTGDERRDRAARHNAWRLAEVATRESLSPVERLEVLLHPWVGFAIMPLFALANAGMPFHASDVANPVTLAVFVGLTVGKPVGIVLFAWLSIRLGLARRPRTMTWGMLVGGGLLSGIGFAMALFIAELSFPVALRHSAKLGILAASAASATAGVAVLYWSTKGVRVGIRPRRRAA